MWKRFDTLVANEVVTSTREVRRELKIYARADEQWLRDNSSMFTTPTAEEAQIVREIYRVRHFQQNIEQRKILKGGLNADPFVVAKAAVNDATVITLESATPNAARIPNICHHFKIRCLNLEEFMEEEGWQF